MVCEKLNTIIVYLFVFGIFSMGDDIRYNYSNVGLYIWFGNIHSSGIFDRYGYDYEHKN
jgi:hypothetical protein